MERTYGFIRVAAIYLLSGIAGYTAALLVLAETLSSGASPALSGIVGAELVRKATLVDDLT